MSDLPIRTPISGTQIEELRALLPTDKLFLSFMRRALEVAAQKAVQPTKEAIRVQLGLPRKLAARRVFVNRMSDAKPFTQVKISGRAFALFTFSPTPTKAGVDKLIAGKHYGTRHAFIRKGPSRGWQVWERVTQPWRSTKGQGLQGWEEQKMKLRLLRGASAADAFNALPGEAKWIERRLMEEVPAQLDSQISRAMALRAKRTK